MPLESLNGTEAIRKGDHQRTSGRKIVSEILQEDCIPLHIFDDARAKHEIELVALHIADLDDANGWIVHETLFGELSHFARAIGSDDFPGVRGEHLTHRARTTSVVEDPKSVRGMLADLALELSIALLEALGSTGEVAPLVREGIEIGF